MIPGYCFSVFHDLESDLHQIARSFHEEFATGVACQQGMLTLPDTWFHPLFGTCLCSSCWDQFSQTFCLREGGHQGLRVHMQSLYLIMFKSHGKRFKFSNTVNWFISRQWYTAFHFYFYSNNDPTSPKGPRKQTTEPILGTTLLGNQSCQKDNIARRRQPYVNTVYRKNFAPVLFSPFFLRANSKLGELNYTQGLI